jgi:hypothetical protein
MKPLNLCKGILALSLLFSFCVLSNAQEPIDTSLEELPRHYTGVECSKLYDALVGYQARLRKDEFETTAQFNKRTQEEMEPNNTDALALQRAIDTDGCR